MNNHLLQMQKIKTLGLLNTKTNPKTTNRKKNRHTYNLLQTPSFVELRPLKIMVEQWRTGFVTTPFHSKHPPFHSKRPSSIKSRRQQTLSSANPKPFKV